MVDEEESKETKHILVCEKNRKRLFALKNNNGLKSIDKVIDFLFDNLIDESIH